MLIIRHKKKHILKQEIFVQLKTQNQSRTTYNIYRDNFMEYKTIKRIAKCSTTANQ